MANALVLKKLEAEVSRLVGCEGDIRKNSVYERLLTGDERKPSVRSFALAAYEQQGHKCTICGEIFEFDQMQSDHIKPWSKGGHTTPDNCQMLCTDCNLKKGAN